MKGEEFRGIAQREGWNLVVVRGNLSMSEEEPPWSLIEGDVETCGDDAAVYVLQTGDHLTVHNPNGTVRWQGLIRLENLMPVGSKLRLDEWVLMFAPPDGPGKKPQPFTGTLLRKT